MIQYRRISARSRAVVLCTPYSSSASSPLGVTKCVAVQPISAAFRFIFSAKPSTLPPTCSAIITAASLSEFSISAYRRSPSKNCSPSSAPICTRGCPAALADTVTRSWALPCSSARIQVIIFVVLAMGSCVSASFSNSTRPESASIRQAERAYSSDSLISSA